MKNLFESLFNWWKLRNKVRKYSKTVYINSLLEVPQKLGKKIYLVGNKDGLKKWAVFSCPCSRKSRVEVNLMQSRKPFWLLTIAKEKVTLSPSVIVTKTCNCHFWMKNSKSYNC